MPPEDDENRRIVNNMAKCARACSGFGASIREMAAVMEQLSGVSVVQADRSLRRVLDEMIKRPEKENDVETAELGCSVDNCNDAWWCCTCRHHNHGSDRICAYCGVGYPTQNSELKTQERAGIRVIRFKSKS